MHNSTNDYSQQVCSEANNFDFLKTILAERFGLSNDWKKNNAGYSHKKHSVRLRVSSKGNHYVINDSGNHIGSTDAYYAYNLVEKGYNLSTSKDVLNKILELTNKSKSDFTSTPENTYQHIDYTVPARQTPYIPNTGEVKIYHAGVQYATDLDSKYSNTCFAYIAKKQCVHIEYVKRKGIYKPILSVTKEGEKGSYTTRYDNQNFAYALCEGQNKQFVNPTNPNKQYKKLYAELTFDPYDGLKNYVLEYSSLPIECPYIFFVEGENDCLAFNAHYNKFGWYAVTVGGVSTSIRVELIKLLTPRCNHIFTLYDNDPAGEKGMSKIEKEHGIKAIRISKYFNQKNYYPTHRFDENGTNLTLNDICDCIDVLGIDVLQSVIETEISLLLEVKATAKTDTISEPTPLISYLPTPTYRPKNLTCTNVTYSNYVTGEGGIYDDIKACLVKNHKVMLKAFAGAGKGEIAKLLSKDVSFMQKIGRKRIIVLEPTAILAKQQSQNLNAEMFGDGNKIGKKALRTDDIFIATYDQYSKFTDQFIKESLIIGDEADMLISEYGYRSKAMQGVLSVIEKAKYVLATTATPNLEFCEMFDFHTLNAVCSDDANVQKIKITPIFLGKSTAKDLLPIIEKYSDSTAKNIVQLNDKKINSAFTQLINAKYGDDKAVEMSSELKGTPLYNQLVRTGKFDEKTDIAFVTSSLNAGFSLLDPTKMFLVNPKATRDLVQFAARGRFDRKTGVNKAVELVVFFTDTDKMDKKAILERFKAFKDKIGVSMPDELYNHQAKIKDKIKGLDGLCVAFNHKVIDFKDVPNNEYLSIICENGTYRTNKLAVIHEFESELQAVLKSDFISFCAEIQYLNPNISFENIVFEESFEDKEARALIDEMKEKEAASKQTIIEMLCSENKEEALLAAYNEHMNFDQHEAITSELTYTPTKTDKAIVGAKKGEALSVTMQYLEIKKLTKELSICENVLNEKLPIIFRENKYDLARGRVLSQIELSEQATCNAEANHYGQMSEKIKAMVKVNDIITKKQMIAIYNQCLNLTNVTNFTESNFQKIKRLFDQLFEVEQIVRMYSGGASSTKYKIVRELLCDNCLVIDTKEDKKVRAKAAKEAYDKSDKGIAAHNAKEAVKEKKKTAEKTCKKE